MEDHETAAKARNDSSDAALGSSTVEAEQEIPASSASSSTSSLPPTRIRLTWLGCSIAVGIALLWAAFLVLKFHFFFRFDLGSRISKQWSPLQLSCFIGVEIGLLTIIALFVFLIPAMILTWTTALLFDYACSRGLARRQLLIADGNKLAREIFLSTLKSVIREGNFIAMLVMVFCLLGAFFSTHILELQAKAFSLW